MYDPELYSLAQQDRNISAAGTPPEINAREENFGTGDIGTVTFGRPFRGFPLPDVEYPDFEGMGKLADTIAPGPILVLLLTANGELTPQPYAEAIDSDGKRVVGSDALKIIENGVYKSQSFLTTVLQTLRGQL